MSKIRSSTKLPRRHAPEAKPHADAVEVPAPSAASAPRFTVLQPVGGDAADGAWCGPDGCHVPATAPADPQSPGKA
ncbi:MAG TPA: hypothetical protein VFQ95_06900 [Rhodanobacteraceae bacterium]|nr:hypothetical protein [Rhodanobacteraceae bacterium]